MIKIILESWHEGLEKVSLAKLQMEMLGKSLKESKTNVDLLLNDEKVIIAIDNLDLAEKFLHEANKLGANCILNKNNKIIM